MDVKQITLGEQVIPIEEVCIPDLWHAATYLRDQGKTAMAEAVLDTWHYALAMKRTIEG